MKLKTLVPDTATTAPLSAPPPAAVVPPTAPIVPTRPARGFNPPRRHTAANLGKYLHPKKRR